MTRAFTRKPVWTWVCDSCHQESVMLAWTQSSLASANDMRERGWYIAEKFGDKCRKCVMLEMDQNQ